MNSVPANATNRPVNLFGKIGRKGGFLWEFRAHWMLYLMTVPALIYIIIFRYVPMAGIVMAFSNFNPRLGMFGSPWVGLENFRFFFRGARWQSVTFNTLYLNVLFIITGTVVSILIAIAMTELRKGLYVRVSQTIMTLPNFLSWVIVSLFALVFIGSTGLINQGLSAVGGKPISFFTTPEIWPGLLVILRIWKGAGFGAVVYMAAITGMDTEITEAAVIDGASQIKRIWYITLPLLKDTVILLTLLSVGSIFYGDFGMIYTIVGDTNALYPTTDVIDTYVFRALRVGNNFGRAAAVGLYQSVIGFILVVVTNAVVKRVNPESAIF